MFLIRKKLSCYTPFSLPTVSGVTSLIQQVPISHTCPKPNALGLQLLPFQAVSSKSPCCLPDSSWLPFTSPPYAPTWEGLHLSSSPTESWLIKAPKPCIQLPVAEIKDFLNPLMTVTTTTTCWWVGVSKGKAAPYHRMPVSVRSGQHVKQFLSYLINEMKKQSYMLCRFALTTYEKRSH